MADKSLEKTKTSSSAMEVDPTSCKRRPENGHGDSTTVKKTKKIIQQDAKKNDSPQSAKSIKEHFQKPAGSTSCETGAGGGDPESQPAATTETLSQNQRFEKLMARTEEMINEWKIVKDRLDQYGGEIHELNCKQDQMNKSIESLQRKEDETRNVTVQVQRQANLNLEKNYANEQYLRNYNLRIYGLEDEKDETTEQCMQKVLTLFKDRLHLDVKQDEFDVVHRLPRPKTVPKTTPKSSKSTLSSSQEDRENHRGEEQKAEEEPPRAVIVRFLRRQTKNAVIKERKKLKKKDGETTCVVIKEDLTKFHQQLLAQASKFGDSAWSSEGKILMKKGGRIKEIKSTHDIF